MTDVFISYKRSDRDRARAIAEMFAANGHDVWWDVELLPGQNFLDEINSVVKNAKATVVLWTPESIKSEWVKAEAAMAMNRGTLIPVWLEKTNLPIPYNTLHTLDLTDWSGSPEDPILADLLKSINVLAGEPAEQLTKRSSEEIDEVLARPKHETDYWASVDRKEPQSIIEYEEYLIVFGEGGAFASLARLRVAALREQEKKIKIPGFGTWLAWGGVAMGIAVGAFTIADQLGWLQNNGEDPVVLSDDGIVHDFSDPESTEKLGDLILPPVIRMQDVGLDRVERLIAVAARVKIPAQVTGETLVAFLKDPPADDPALKTKLENIRMAILARLNVTAVPPDAVDIIERTKIAIAILQASGDPIVAKLEELFP